MTPEQAKFVAAQIANFQESLLRHMAEGYALLTRTGTLQALLVQQSKTTGPSCPRCGSERVADVSGMGASEVQCSDCLSIFAP